MSCVLIIDDDDTVQQIMRAILERDGYEIACGADGDLGIRAFNKIHPQLVIVDILMPNQEGLETIMQLRALDPKIPIIAMSVGTRSGIADFLAMSLKLGASDILRKPFERQELSAIVRKFLPVRLQATDEIGANCGSRGPAAVLPSHPRLRDNRHNPHPDRGSGSKPAGDFIA